MCDSSSGRHKKNNHQPDHHKSTGRAGGRGSERNRLIFVGSEIPDISSLNYSNYNIIAANSPLRAIYSHRRDHSTTTSFCSFPFLAVWRELYYNHSLHSISIDTDGGGGTREQTNHGKYLCHEEDEDRDDDDRGNHNHWRGRI